MLFAIYMNEARFDLYQILLEKLVDRVNMVKNASKCQSREKMKTNPDK